MLKITFYTVLILNFVGCASNRPRLKEETAKIRIVTSTPSGCKYTGRVVGRWSGFYFTGGEAVGNAQVKMFNAAAEVGANTIEVLERGLEGAAGAYSVGETYFCNQ